uniref:Uncharacterized protein n=1 Tax=Odontella aurita TaxID=265563 RepID=A0A7S4HTY9_9STRA|mmetsp:Transcript_15213/g.44152  ORF Transcript_15213/g.44152 Transcript_15213/m.44152 type:complete len:178 (+) Transcript_15213:151-684(+)
MPTPTPTHQPTAETTFLPTPSPTSQSGGSGVLVPPDLDFPGTRPRQQSTEGGGTTLGAGAIAGIAVGAAALLSLGVIAFLLCQSRRSRKGGHLETSAPSRLQAPHSLPGPTLEYGAGAEEPSIVIAIVAGGGGGDDTTFANGVRAQYGASPTTGVWMDGTRDAPAGVASPVEATVAA